MQPLQICIGPSIRIDQESWCLPYAGFLLLTLKKKYIYIHTNQGGQKNNYKKKMYPKYFAKKNSL